MRVDRKYILGVIQTTVQHHRHNLISAGYDPAVFEDAAHRKAANAIAEIAQNHDEMIDLLKHWFDGMRDAKRRIVLLMQRRGFLKVSAGTVAISYLGPYVFAEGLLRPIP